MTKPTWSTACLDWEKRIVDRRSLVPFDPLFPDAADSAMRVYRDLKIVDMAGRPAIGEVCRPWVFDLPRTLFGSYDTETGRRLISEYMLLVSKKNWKSGTAASIMLTALTQNWRDSAEFLIVAPTIEIANNSFGPAADMVRADPEMWVESGGFLRVQPSFRTITDLRTNSTLKVIAADNETVGGKKASGIFIDELWLFGKRAGAEDMFREVTGGLASRPEGFVIYATTQSDEAPDGVFKQKLDYFRAVRDGEIKDPRSLGILYEYPRKMLDAEAWRDRSTWYITNPNLGASVDEEYIERKFVEADRAGGSSRAGFLAKHLNVEIGMGLRGNRWPGAEFWTRQADPDITLDYLLEACDVIVVGLDGGGLDDLYGVAVMGRHRDTRKWLVWLRAWCHEIVLDRRPKIVSKLRDFEKAKELIIVSDELGDITDIVALIERVMAAGLLGSVCVDPAGLGEMVEALAQIGVTLESGLLLGVPQGFALMNSIKTCERKLANGTMRHCGAALGAWCVGNLKIEPTATAIRATKQTAGDAKIDPAMAMFNCAFGMMRNPEPRGGSIYDDEAAYNEAFGRGDTPDGIAADAWSPAILADPGHPEHAKHLAAFHDWQDLQGD
ncbi:MAG: terminase large subunit [Rhizorhabdus sp.]|nr:terminase large subunit [Rhizorhabdus sp.]